jgi:tripartite-type tricarboxylate transporter receptor subunit TctC
MRFKAKLTGLVAGLLIVGATTARADYPDRNIEIIFPWGPGVALSAVQVIAEGMSKELGVSLPVVSNPGAAGVRATKTGLSRPADGYTIIDAWVAPLVLQPILGKADWSAKDFTPLWSGVSIPFALATRANDDRWTDFPTFIQYIKGHLGNVRYSSGSYGNLPHMILAQTLKANGVYARNIPYKQDGDALKDLRGGVLDFMFVSPATYASNKDAFVPLVVLNDREDVRPLFDNAPLVTVFGTDIGLTELSPMGWNWFTVHPDTPPDRVEVLRKAMKAALDNPDVVKRLKSFDFFIPKYPPERFDEIVTNVRKQLTTAAKAIAWEKEQLK